MTETEKMKLLDLLSAEKEEKREIQEEKKALMPPADKTPKSRNWLLRLVGIENRLRDVEQTIAESKGKSSGLVTAKDIFVVLCGIAAVVIPFIRLTQN